MAKDPVCGMTVSEAKAKFTSQHQGATYYFCGPGCLASFNLNPIKYLR